MGRRRKEQKIRAQEARFKRECGPGQAFFAVVEAFKQATKEGSVPECTPESLKRWAMRRKTRHGFHE